MSKALYALSEEDPTFQVAHRRGDGQTVISGMGELHLEVLVDRMMREFKVDGHRRQAPGRLPRDRSPRRSRTYTYTHKKQTGGSGQYAEMLLTMETSGPGGGYEFDDKISGGRIPKEYIPSVDARHPRRDDATACSPATRRSTSRSADRRQLPRRRLIGDGVQDRRHPGLQGGCPQGQPGPARADHGGRGRHARRLHGRRHRRPQQPSRQGRQDGAAWQQPRRLRRGARCRRCSATPPTCGRRPRVGPPTPCSSTATSRPRRTSRKRSSPASPVGDLALRHQSRCTFARPADTPSSPNTHPEQERQAIPWPRRSSSGRSRM